MMSELKLRATSSKGQLQNLPRRGYEYAKQLGARDEADLLRICSDRHHEAPARGRACLALGFTKYEKAVPALVKLANDDDLSVVVNATRALAMIGSRRAVLPMMRLAQAASRLEVRNRAVDVLGLIGDRRAERLLINIIGDEEADESTRCCAVQAIPGLPKGRARKSRCLTRILRHPSPLLRWNALNSLGVIGDYSALPEIRKHLKDKENVPGLPSKQTVSTAARAALRNIKVCSEGAD
jgi:HEAT repeat protein